MGNLKSKNVKVLREPIGLMNGLGTPSSYVAICFANIFGGSALYKVSYQILSIVVTKVARMKLLIKSYQELARIF